MFEEIFFPPAARRQRAAPLADERARYLCHLRDLGTSRASLRKNANDHLNLVRLLNFRDGKRIGWDEVLIAASIWREPCGRRSNNASTAKAHQRFVSHCHNLLRHIGWVQEAQKAHHPHHDQVLTFANWLRLERGLSEPSIESLCHAADHFFFWLAERNLPLAVVAMVDIDASITAEFDRGAWSRRTIHNHANRLRTFFAFAQGRGWCRQGLAAGIMAPGFRPDEKIPKGIKRIDVIRLLEATQGERPSSKRDFAILMLLANYGLRASEVAGLTLDDIDWENSMIRVRCTKPGKTYLWPLSQGVGHAILRYIREARPNGHGRSLFLTTCAPIKPLGRKNLSKLVSDRLAKIGITSGRRGPHALRHAAAQHLLDRGTSMKVIGDFLGHRHPASTAIYAKVDLKSLREVAALDLEGLA
jgi:integrase/recombinase XerD